MTASSDTPTESGLLRWLAALGDLARLRILRLLETTELSVGELAKVLQFPQSTVSRHLKLLHDGGWIMKRTEGTASLYRMDNDSLSPDAGQLWRVARSQLGSSPTFQEDDRRVASVLAHRQADSKAFFGRLGGQWDHLRRELFGEAFTAEALLHFLDPTWVLADLGCGTGAAAEYLAPIVNRVIAIDREPALLDAARRRLAGFDNVEFRQGELTDLPIADGEVDAAIAFLVMVYIPQPDQMIREVARILRHRPNANSIAMIVDMVAHDRDSFRHTMGHCHLGFDEPQINQWAKSAGLSDVRYRTLRPDTTAKGPGLFVATMRKRPHG